MPYVGIHYRRPLSRVLPVLAGMALLLTAAGRCAAAVPAAEGDVSTYIYGPGDGWSLPSQTAQRLATKREEQLQRDEASARARAAKLAADLAAVNQAAGPAPRSEYHPPSPASGEGAWRVAQLAMAMLAGIGIAALWNYFRQRSAISTAGPNIISIYGVQAPSFATADAAAARPGIAAAPSPRVSPRRHHRRHVRFVAPRRARPLARRRDPHNESIRMLSLVGILPKWVRDMTPMLSDGARLAGAVPTDDVQMYQQGGDAIPNYAYIMDPQGMAASAERQKQATATVWSHQQWIA